METTYRLIALADRSQTGDTAASPVLAKLVPADLDRSMRIGMEQTDWVKNFDKMKVQRSILVEAESKPGEWLLGV